MNNQANKFPNYWKVSVSGSKSPKAFLAAALFSLCASQVFANSNPDAVGDLINMNVEKSKPLFGDHQKVSREELIEIFRSDKLLCYGMSDEGTCEFVEVGDTFHSDGFTSVNFYLTSRDGYVISNLFESQWNGDKLCAKGGSQLAMMATYKSTVANLDQSGMYRSDDVKILVNRAIEESFEGYSACVEYIRSKDAPHVLLELLYVDGVLQDLEGYSEITVLGKGDGKVKLHF